MKGIVFSKKGGGFFQKIKMYDVWSCSEDRYFKEIKTKKKVSRYRGAVVENTK